MIERRRHRDIYPPTILWCRDIAPDLIGALAIVPVIAAGASIVLLIAVAAFGWFA